MLAEALETRASWMALDFSGMSALERLRAVRAGASGRAVLTTSFTLEEQALAHMIFSHDLEIEVVALDTGRLAPEIFAVWAAMEERHGRRIAAVCPRHDRLEALIAEQGIVGPRSSVQARLAAHNVRRVEPLARALNGAEIWVTGLRAGRVGNGKLGERGASAFATFDETRGLLRANPLLDWSRERVLAFLAAEGVAPPPFNYDNDFESLPGDRS